MMKRRWSPVLALLLTVSLLLPGCSSGENAKIRVATDATWPPFESVDEKTKEIPEGKKIVLLDLHGKQTYLAARFLTKEGFKDIVMLDKGFYDGWLKAGLPIVSK